MQQRLTIPSRGITTASSFVDQPAEFAAVGQMSNVWPQDSDAQRRRGGTRWGTVLQLAGRLGNGPIQGMCRVIRPTADQGYTIAAATGISAGTSKESGVLGGNAFLVDADWATEWAFDSPAAGTGSKTASSICFSRDGTKAFTAVNHTVGGFLRATLACVNVSTGAQVWQIDLSDASANRIVNHLCCTATWLVVSTNNAVRLYNPDTGALVEEKVISWASEVVATGFAASLGQIRVAFNGSLIAGTILGGALADGTTLSPTLASGVTAEHFRAGVMAFGIIESTAVGPVTSYFVFQSLGIAIPTSSPLYEANHQYFRLSEQSRTTPYGASIRGIAVKDDGSFVLIRTNRGWGPNFDWRPGWANEPDARKRRSPVTVCGVSAAGTMIFESDPTLDEGPQDGSGFYAGQPHYNDILNPLLLAVGLASDGRIYVGGRQSALAKSAYCLNPAGSPQWAANVQSTTGAVRDNAIAVNPTDQNPVFGGTRNSAWDGASGAQANAWKLNSLTGSVVKTIDLSDGSGTDEVASVACNASGQTVFGTDRF